VLDSTQNGRSLPRFRLTPEVYLIVEVKSIRQKPAFVDSQVAKRALGHLKPTFGNLKHLEVALPLCVSVTVS
jgi:hypothetical protein